jgi:hypothetical protein
MLLLTWASLESGQQSLIAGSVDGNHFRSARPAVAPGMSPSTSRATTDMLTLLFHA